MDSHEGVAPLFAYPLLLTCVVSRAESIGSAYDMAVDAVSNIAILRGASACA
jgi:hypothetical protein